MCWCWITWLGLPFNLRRLAFRRGAEVKAIRLLIYIVFAVDWNNRFLSFMNECFFGVNVELLLLITHVETECYLFVRYSVVD